MTVIMDPPGTPLPEGHPFKGGCVIFGMKRPPNYKKQSTPKEKDQDTKPDLSPFELEARESYEQAMLHRFKRNTGSATPEEAPSSESTTPASPEKPSPEISTDQE